MKLEFTHKTAYGRDRFYPANPDAEFILSLMSMNTVSLELLKKMKEHGWDVKISYQPFDL